MVFNAPWYVSNKILHEHSKIQFVEDEIKRMTNRHLQNLPEHSNEQVSQLHVSPEA
jgi:t-SNARE complex subunit (syntaxin)